jgi:membrane protease YdiL (CAAX protease family)
MREPASMDVSWWTTSEPSSDPAGSVARRDISTPARLARPEASLVLLIAALFATFPLLPRPGLIALALALALLALVRRSLRPRFAHLAVLCALTVTAVAAVGMTLWPLPLVLSTASYLVLLRTLPMGARPDWLRRGHFARDVRLAIGAAVLVSGAALVLWFLALRPDYSALGATLFPKLPIWMLAIGVVLFSMVNAAFEEFIYRGALLQALDAAVGVGPLPLLLQAGAFGILHINGFPRGATGVALAAIYGVMMGLVRRRSCGLLAPWVAHVFADTVIGFILLTALLR